MDRNDMDMGAEQARVFQLLQKMLARHESDIDCATCGDRMDCLAELVLNGQTPQGALEAIQRHLECCRCCAYEFDMLVAVLRAEQLQSSL
jgi:hypothetical protein